MRHLHLALLALTLGVPRSAAGQTPWMFDFNLSLTKDQAYVTQHLNTLKSGLPGVPPDGIHELVSKQTKLYFYQDVIDALTRARTSGPQSAPAVVRTPVRCALHASFKKPSLLLASPPPLCDVQQNTALGAFDAAKLKLCGYVEFPESYVYDQKLPSLILPTTTADLDVLIAILGEALTHPTYPVNLIDPSFLPQARKIIGKVRYSKLKTELAARKAEYQSALAKLQASSQCFDPAKLATFAATVGKLVAELSAVEQDLDGIYSAGLVQALADRKAIEAKGRMRADLPYPALTDRERELLAFYVGGVSWRIRGGGLISEKLIPLGLALTFVGPPYQLIGDIAGGSEGKDVGFPIYVDENAGYYKWYDMGTDPGSNDKYSDLVEMTNRGKGSTNLVRPVLEKRGFDIRHLVAGGLMMGPCYFYIWEEMPKFVVGPSCSPPPGYPLPPNSPGCLSGDYVQFLEWPTASGEFCTGGALALGLVKTLLLGKPGKACTPDCIGKPCGADNTCGGTCGVCPDGGVPPRDGSVTRDGGGGDDVPAHHDGLAARDGGVAPGKDAASPEQPSPNAGGCSVATAPASPSLFLLVLTLVVAFTRRRAR